MKEGCINTLYDKPNKNAHNYSVEDFPRSPYVTPELVFLETRGLSSHPLGPGWSNGMTSTSLSLFRWTLGSPPLALGQSLGTNRSQRRDTTASVVDAPPYITPEFPPCELLWVSTWTVRYAQVRWVRRRTERRRVRGGEDGLRVRLSVSLLVRGNIHLVQWEQRE